MITQWLLRCAVITSTEGCWAKCGHQKQAVNTALTCCLQFEETSGVVKVQIWTWQVTKINHSFRVRDTLLLLLHKERKSTERTKWTYVSIIGYSFSADWFSVMCPLAEMSSGWEVESTSPPVCQPQGSLHGGTSQWAFVLVESPPPAPQSSFDRVRLLALFPHSLSTLMGLMIPLLQNPKSGDTR